MEENSDRFITLNFSEVPVPKRRGRLKAKVSRKVYRRLIKAGFNRAEADFGSTMGVDLENEKLQEAIMHRENVVQALMNRFDWDRERAVEDASMTLKEKLLAFTGQNEDLILFYEAYPEW